MIKKYYQSEKGAISVFVMITMVFFLASMIGIYMVSSKRAQMQTESVELIQSKYYTEDEENQIYQNKMAPNTETIPIYTKEQLWAVASGKLMQIEGKVYTFSNSAKYELKNDIIMNIEQIEDGVKIEDADIIKHNYEIYYYYQGDYYVPTEYYDGSNTTNLAQGIPILSASGENFSDISNRVTGLVGKYALFTKKKVNQEFLTKEANELIGTIADRNYYKENSQPAIATIAYIVLENGEKYIAPLLVSTSQEAVTYTTSDSGSTLFPATGDFEYKGIQFYYSNTGYWFEENRNYSYCFSPVLNAKTDNISYIDAAKKLIDSYFENSL